MKIEMLTKMNCAKDEILTNQTARRLQPKEQQPLHTRAPFNDCHWRPMLPFCW